MKLEINQNSKGKKVVIDIGDSHIFLVIKSIIVFLKKN